MKKITKTFSTSFNVYVFICDVSKGDCGILVGNRYGSLLNRLFLLFTRRDLPSSESRRYQKMTEEIWDILLDLEEPKNTSSLSSFLFLFFLAFVHLLNFSDTQGNRKLAFKTVLYLP